MKSWNWVEDNFSLSVIYLIYYLNFLDPAKHEVQLKIDNLNVEDMFDSYRLNRLLDVFRHKLWRESIDDLYVTFLASAVHLGARLPLRPNDGEGYVQLNLWLTDFNGATPVICIL